MSTAMRLSSPPTFDPPKPTFCSPKLLRLDQGSSRKDSIQPDPPFTPITSEPLELSSKFSWSSESPSSLHLYSSPSAQKSRPFFRHSTSEPLLTGAAVMSSPLEGNYANMRSTFHDSSDEELDSSLLTSPVIAKFRFGSIGSVRRRVRPSFGLYPKPDSLQTSPSPSQSRTDSISMGHSRMPSFRPSSKPASSQPNRDHRNSQLSPEAKASFESSIATFFGSPQAKPNTAASHHSSETFSPASIKMAKEVCVVGKAAGTSKSKQEHVDSGSPGQQHKDLFISSWLKTHKGAKSASHESLHSDCASVQSAPTLPRGRSPPVQVIKQLPCLPASRPTPSSPSTAGQSLSTANGAPKPVLRYDPTRRPKLGSPQNKPIELKQVPKLETAATPSQAPANKLAQDTTVTCRRPRKAPHPSCLPPRRPPPKTDKLPEPPKATQRPDDAEYVIEETDDSTDQKYTSSDWSRPSVDLEILPFHAVVTDIKTIELPDRDSSGAPLVELNVGGRKFTTSMETICRHGTDGDRLAAFVKHAIETAEATICKTPTSAGSSRCSNAKVAGRSANQPAPPQIKRTYTRRGRRRRVLRPAPSSVDSDMAPRACQSFGSTAESRDDDQPRETEYESHSSYSSSTNDSLTDGYQSENLIDSVRILEALLPNSKMSSMDSGPYYSFDNRFGFELSPMPTPGDIATDPTTPSANGFFDFKTSVDSETSSMPSPATLAFDKVLNPLLAEQATYTKSHQRELQRISHAPKTRRGRRLVCPSDVAEGDDEDDDMSFARRSRTAPNLIGRGRSDSTRSDISTASNSTVLGGGRASAFHPTLVFTAVSPIIPEFSRRKVVKVEIFLDRNPRSYAALLDTLRDGKLPLRYTLDNKRELTSFYHFSSSSEDEYEREDGRTLLRLAELRKEANWLGYENVVEICERMERLSTVRV